MRRPHYLSGNRANELPSHIIAVDVETDSLALNEKQVEAKLRFGFACYSYRDGSWSAPEWLKFKTAPAFWKWAISHTRKKRRLFIYAHNVSFDLIVLKQAHYLTRHGWSLTKCILDEPPTMFTWRLGLDDEAQKRENRTIVILDTLNYWRTSLAKLGQQLGLAKLTMPALTDSQTAWDDYCKQDVTIVRAAMISLYRFIVENEFGNYQITAASQAFSAFRHRFMPIVPFCDDSLPALKLARDSYFGGRTEAFRIGKFTGKFYCLDINSEYPFVMSYTPLPVILKSVWLRPTPAEMAKLLARFWCVASVYLKTDAPVYPKRINKRLCWPVGQFWTTLAHAELLHAFEHGAIIKADSIAFYNKGVLFETWVRELYALRKRFENENNQTYASFTKLMLNSLYGKFGQTGRKLEWSTECDIDLIKSETVIDGKTGQNRRRLYYAGVIQEWVNEGESQNSSPAIASGVTSEARLYLWSLIEKAGRENVYYSDTDSLFVNEQGYQNLLPDIDNGVLGKLKLESEASTLEIRGLKDYTFGDRTKIKGVRANAHKVNHNTYIQDTFRGIKGMLRDGDTERVIITQTTKHLKREYTKGVIENGNVRPFTLAESYR